MGGVGDVEGESSWGKGVSGERKKIDLFSSLRNHFGENAGDGGC